MTLLIRNDTGYLTAIILGLFISFGLPIILFIIGFSMRNKNTKTSKALYIIATVYLIISLGVCGIMMI